MSGLTIKENPLYKSVVCRDGVERSIGRIRVHPDLVENMSVPPMDYVSEGAPAEEDDGIPFMHTHTHQVFISESLQLPWNTDSLWVQVPSGDAPFELVEDKKDDVVNGNLKFVTYQIDGEPVEATSNSMYNPSTNTYIVDTAAMGMAFSDRVLAYKNGRTARLDALTRTKFFDIADEFLIEYFKEDYPDLLAANFL